VGLDVAQRFFQQRRHGAFFSFQADGVPSIYPFQGKFKDKNPPFRQASTPFPPSLGIRPDRAGQGAARE
jgi:hypothetical protein